MSGGGYYDPANVCAGLNPQDPMYLCAGCSLNPSTGYVAWTQANCPLEYQRLYYEGRYQQAQVYANNLLTTYQDYNVITEPGQADYNPFQEVLHQFCSGTAIAPGVCQNYLNYAYCPKLAYEQLDSAEAGWCGCFTLPSESQQELYGTNVACYPLCHLTTTIQRVDERGDPLQCENQVCAIDNVSVDVTNSRGSVNVTNLCPGCNGQCTCTVNNVDVTGAALNINNYCGDQVTCYHSTAERTYEIPCNQPFGSWLLALLLLLVAVFVIIVLGLAFWQARS